MGFIGKLFRSMTVEPTSVVYYFAYSIYTVGAMKLLLQKTCSPDFQPEMNKTCKSEEIADVTTMRSVLRELLPPFIMVIAGAWRDWTGLTFPLLALSISGATLAATVSLISAFFWEMSPMTTAFLESLCAGAGGGWQLLHLATYCYLSNKTTLEERTARFTWLMVAMTVGALVGNYVSGYLLVGLGYKWFFALVIIVKLISIFLGFIFMKETRTSPPEGQKFFNLKKFLVPFNRRGFCAVNWMMILNSWMLYCASVAEQSNRLAFTENQFHIQIEQFGTYQAYCIGIHFVGLILYPPILIRGLKWNDFTITIVSLILYIISYTGISLANSISLLYIFSMLNPMKNSLLVLHRSILTKCVDDNELGIYCSFIGIGEGFIPLGFLYLYNFVFKRTIRNDGWLGAYHLISAGIGIFMLLNICIAAYLYKGQCCREGKCNEGCRCGIDSNQRPVEDPKVKQ